MTKVALVIVSIVLALNATAQTAPKAVTEGKTHEKKVLNFYGQEHLNRMDNKSPNLTKYLDYYVNNGYHVEDSPKDLSEFPDIFSVRRVTSKANVGLSLATTYDPATFNILTYDVQATEHRQYFRVGNTGKILVIKSRKEIMTKVNQL